MTSRSDACAPAAETERVRVEGFTNRLIYHSFLRLNLKKNVCYRSLTVTESNRNYAVCKFN